jgi:hypothetical protein
LDWLFLQVANAAQAAVSMSAGQGFTHANTSGECHAGARQRGDDQKMNCHHPAAACAIFPPVSASCLFLWGDGFHDLVDSE